MIRNPEEMFTLTNDLAASTWTLSAIGALFESGLIDHLREPCTLDDLGKRCHSLSRAQIERCLAVAVAAGVVVTEGERHRLTDGALPFVQRPMRTGVSGIIRATLMQAMAFLDGSSRDHSTTGWQHTDALMLQAQGDSSAGLAPMMKMKIVPALDDLGARLERPGARFLDVGVGVAALSIAMCRAFPQLHVVGVDVLDPALVIARQNVVAAKLEDRIELRRSGAEELRDEAAYDLAWLPSFFIPTANSAAKRIHATLKPGGWITFAVSPSGGAPRQRAVDSLINELWGGASLTPAEAEATLLESGFTSVRTLPGPDWAPALVVGRR